MSVSFENVGRAANQLAAGQQTSSVVYDNSACCGTLLHADAPEGIDLVMTYREARRRKDPLASEGLQSEANADTKMAVQGEIRNVGRTVNNGHAPREAG